ncbi:MAG: hypothetical protein MI700_03660, partial [Balneolales bacterium]|nr:hypothetical protein [Balneolales bacterium]
FAAFLFWPDAESTAYLETGSTTEVVMYKQATCMCCAKWADHMAENGFEVEQIPTDTLMEVKTQNGISMENASCHTAFVGGYVVEGHVPAKEVERLLAEKPDAIGLTVPAMPIGSPGMEVEGREADNYDVLLIARDGSTSVWASY